MLADLFEPYAAIWGSGVGGCVWENTAAEYCGLECLEDLFNLC